MKLPHFTQTTESQIIRPMVARQKTFVLAATLLTTVTARIVFDTTVTRSAKGGGIGQTIFGFALVPAMVGLLIYALCSKEVQAKPKFFSKPIPWRPMSRRFIDGCWRLLCLTGYPQRVPYVFVRLFAERAVNNMVIQFNPQEPAPENCSPAGRLGD